MKDLKGFILFIVIAIVAGFIILGALKRQDAFNDINKYVKENKSELETIKDDYLNGNEVSLPEEVESVSYKSATEMMYLIEKGLMHPVHRDIVPKVLKLKYKRKFIDKVIKYANNKKVMELSSYLLN